MKHSLLIVGILIGMVLAGGLFAWRAGVGAAGDTGGGVSPRRNLEIAHGLPTSHPVHLGIVHFSERLEALSGGRITCKIFPSEQLGNEVVCLEKLQTGSLDFTKVSSAPVSNFVPVFSLFSLPYLFDDEEHYQRVVDGPLGVELLERIATLENGRPSGMIGLTYFDAGSRNFYAKSAIRGPEDLRGKAVRVMSDPMAIEMVRALGGNPTPMAFGELYSALQQGNVAAAENNPPSFVESGHIEVCKHFTFDHHTRNPDLFLVSRALWDQLSDQEQEWMKAAAREAAQVQRKLWNEGTAAAIATMREQGVKIYEPDLAPFQAATAGVIQRFAVGEVGKFVEKIRALSDQDGSDQTDSANLGVDRP